MESCATGVGLSGSVSGGWLGGILLFFVCIIQMSHFYFLCSLLLKKYK